MARKLVREGGAQIKETMEDLLNGKAFHTEIDEQIVFNQLEPAAGKRLSAGGSFSYQ